MGRRAKLWGHCCIQPASQPFSQTASTDRQTVVRLWLSVSVAAAEWRSATLSLSLTVCAVLSVLALSFLSPTPVPPLQPSVLSDKLPSSPRTFFKLPKSFTSSHSYPFVSYPISDSSHLPNITAAALLPFPHLSCTPPFLFRSTFISTCLNLLFCLCHLRFLSKLLSSSCLIRPLPPLTSDALIFICLPLFGCLITRFNCHLIFCHFNFSVFSIYPFLCIF